MEDIARPEAWLYGLRILESRRIPQHVTCSLNDSAIAPAGRKIVDAVPESLHHPRHRRKATYADLYEGSDLFFSLNQYGSARQNHHLFQRVIGTFPSDVDVDSRPRALTPPPSSTPTCLLLQLPAELRLLIWEYVFSNPRVHLIRKYRKMSHIVCRGDQIPGGCNHEADISLLPVADNTKTTWNLLSVPLLCRQIYRETISLIYRLPEFSAPSAMTFDLFWATTLPQRFANVRHLSLKLRHIRGHFSTFSIVRYQMPRLKDFHLTITNQALLRHGCRRRAYPFDDDFTDRLATSMSPLHGWSPPESQNKFWRLTVTWQYNLQHSGLLDAERDLTERGYLIKMSKEFDFPQQSLELTTISWPKPSQTGLWL